MALAGKDKQIIDLSNEQSAQNILASPRERAESNPA